MTNGRKGFGAEILFHMVNPEYNDSVVVVDGWSLFEGGQNRGLTVFSYKF